MFDVWVNERRLRVRGLRGIVFASRMLRGRPQRCLSVSGGHSYVGHQAYGYRARSRVGLPARRWLAEQNGQLSQKMHFGLPLDLLDLGKSLWISKLAMIY